MGKPASSDNLETPQRYAKQLSECADVLALRELLFSYAELAKDAIPIAAQMDDDEWPEFQRGLKLERRGKFAGEVWASKYLPILMPEPMLTVAGVADQYKVPFIVALRRIREIRPDLLELRPLGVSKAGA
jgi:hypothetical protein